MQKIKFYLQNLKCTGCEKSITDMLEKINSLLSYEINIAESSLTLHLMDLPTAEIIKMKLAKLGYPIVGDTNSINQKTKSYLSCMVGKVKNSV